MHDMWMIKRLKQFKLRSQKLAQLLIWLNFGFLADLYRACLICYQVDCLMHFSKSSGTQDFYPFVILGYVIDLLYSTKVAEDDLSWFSTKWGSCKSTLFVTDYTHCLRHAYGIVIICRVIVNFFVFLINRNQTRFSSGTNRYFLSEWVGAIRPHQFIMTFLRAVILVSGHDRVTIYFYLIRVIIIYVLLFLCWLRTATDCAHILNWIILMFVDPIDKVVYYQNL